ncbi:hypothetical protein JTB14_037063 [Gonioctena quinquepunctata]|nr:hypothetical protein JTB14_037063 [Gonioctena quinquepunctata]
MASNEVNCFICGDILQEGEVIEVKKKGLETFRQSSIKRKNNKYKLLVGLKSIVVHDACRKRYNNGKLIAAALRRRSDGTTAQEKYNCDLHVQRSHSKIIAFYVLLR